MNQTPLSMGANLRHYISFNLLNYFRPAARLSVSRDVMMSGVDLTDVSLYQKLIDWNKMKAAGAQGSIIRAGQNLWEDPYFDLNWAASKAAGVPRGSYFFLDSRVPPKPQADLYWSLIKADLGELFHTADYEEKYGGPYAGWRNLYDFMERLLSNGLPPEKLWLYTGYYYWLDHSPQNDAAALNYFGQFQLWLAWYTTNPAYVKIPKPWTDARLWQYGTPAVGAKYGVQTAEIDMDQWTGNLDSYQDYFRLESPAPTPDPDIITQPFQGVRYITGTRFSRKFYLTICDPAQVRFEVAHSSVFPDLLDKPSAVAKRKGAALAWNGGEWDKYVYPYMPKDLSVSDGAVYVPRHEAVPSLVFFTDGRATIAHTNQIGQYQATSGLRYLVENGQMKDYLNGPEVQYTDRRARSIEGLTAEGHVMRLTVDGVYPSQGVQLREAALIMLEFGAVKAFDTGGGGDSVIVLNGEVQNVPEDIDFGENVERRVPEFLLAYPKETTMPIQYSIKSNVPTETRAIRRGPGILFSSIANLPATETIIGDFKYTYTQPLTTDGLTRAQVNDEWFHVKGVIFSQIVDGWIARVHLGKVYTLVTETLPTPDVDEIAYVQTSQELTVTHTDGRKETFRGQNLTLNKV